MNRYHWINITKFIIIENFYIIFKKNKNLIIKIYNSIIKKLDENNKILVKFESLEKKLDKPRKYFKNKF